MTQLLKIFLYIFTICVMFIGVSHACDTNEIDVLGDGTNCQISKFEITTTELTAGDEFRFYMSAMGTFYIDCGGGTLSGNSVSGNVITRSTTDEDLYICTYATGGVKTIRMAGRATVYNGATGDESIKKAAAIRFGAAGLDSATPKLVASIDGELGSIFPTLGQSANQQPVFYATFARTAITTIPANLFAGVFGGRAYMFFRVFYIARSLISIPYGLFNNITTGATKMFYDTFSGCARLTTIPDALFTNINNGAYQMFLFTFADCNAITSIPQDLFAHLTGVAIAMFNGTFQNCGALSGYIPPSVLSDLIAKGSPYTTNMMYNMFNNTNLATSCPQGTVQYVTGYEDYWSGHVSCVDENLVCDAGEYFAAHDYKCSICPENNYCSGGTYPYSETITSGATQCPNNLYSPIGSSSIDQCGRILHIGEDMLYLRSVKQTIPSLNVKIGNDIFYGNMTINDVPMNTNTERKLKLRFNDVTYSVYDDTVQP